MITTWHSFNWRVIYTKSFNRQHCASPCDVVYYIYIYTDLYSFITIKSRCQRFNHQNMRPNYFSSLGFHNLTCKFMVIWCDKTPRKNWWNSRQWIYNGDNHRANYFWWCSSSLRKLVYGPGLLGLWFSRSCMNPQIHGILRRLSIKNMYQPSIHVGILW